MSIHVRFTRSPPASCSDLVERNLITESGLGTITVAGQQISVWCDMDTLGGGWTLLQRRGDFGHERNFFLKKWEDYKLGFGDPREVNILQTLYSCFEKYLFFRTTGLVLLTGTISL